MEEPGRLRSMASLRVRHDWATSPFTFHFHALEKAMAPHSSTLAWKIPWTEEPGRLQSMRSWRVRHDWTTSLSFFAFMHWRRKWQPTPVFLPGESQGRGSLVGCRLWVTQSRTWLKWLISSIANSCWCLARLPGELTEDTWGLVAIPGSTGATSGQPKDPHSAPHAGPRCG